MFFCVYFPVDLEVFFYLGHVKKPLYNTIQYYNTQKQLTHITTILMAIFQVNLFCVFIFLLFSFFGYYSIKVSK